MMLEFLGLWILAGTLVVLLLNAAKVMVRRSYERSQASQK